MMASQGYHSRGWSQLGMGTLPGSRATWVAGYSKDGCPGRWHPSCKGGSELKHPQQQLLTDSGKKASPSRKMSQSWPFQGQDAAALKGKSPPPSPQHPSVLQHFQYHGWGYACLSFPPVQTNPWHPNMGQQNWCREAQGTPLPTPTLGGCFGHQSPSPLCRHVQHLAARLLLSAAAHPGSITPGV